MLDVHSDSAPSNITKLFTRTSNIHTYNTRSSTSQLSSVKYSRLKMQKRKLFCVLVSKSGKRCPMNTKICQRNPSKKEAKRALLNILETEDFYMEPDEIMLNSNTAKLKQFYNIFCSLKNARTFSPLQ